MNRVKNKWKLLFLLAIPLMMITPFSKVEMVSAAPWYGSTKDIAGYDVIKEGSAGARSYVYHGKQGGYETWSAYAHSGILFYGGITLDVSSTSLRPASSGTHSYSISIYLNGHIDNRYLCDNFLKVTLRLRNIDGYIVDQVSERYDSCDDGIHSKIVTLSGYANLLGGNYYYAHVTYKLYSGFVLFYGIANVDFSSYDSDYLQFRQFSLGEV